MGTVPPDVEERLAGASIIAHLATCVDGRPHVAPVWFGYAGDDVLEILTTGKKLENIRHNSRVAVSIQHDVDGVAQWFVVLRGTASVVEDDGATRAAAAAINPKYGASVDEWPENTLVRIDVGSVTSNTYGG